MSWSAEIRVPSGSGRETIEDLIYGVDIPVSVWNGDHQGFQQSVAKDCAVLLVLALKPFVSKDIWVVFTGHASQTDQEADHINVSVSHTPKLSA